MNRKVQIFIEGVVDSGNYSLIELFNDEKINVTSSIQNVSDISKVFTDFTQSFTIPASPVNSAIFEHFYQSDVDATHDPNLRRNAYIEIDTIPFRVGKIQLEKSTVINGRAENYQITFYGTLLSLKDKFAELKLRDLDFTSIDSAYNADYVKTCIEDTANSRAVRFPLISSKRVWTYGGATSTDISTNTGAIAYNELFPAIRVGTLFDLIESKFGLTFEGNFLDASNLRWNNLFLWCKNTENFAITTDTQIVDYYNIATDRGNINSPNFSIANNTIKAVRVQSNEIASSDINIQCATTITAYIDVFINGVFAYTRQGSTNKYIDVYYKNVSTIPTSGDTLSFKFRTSMPAIVTPHIIFRQPTKTLDKPATYRFDCYSKTLTAKTNLSQFIPDISIADFFSGVLKEFNLTCYSTKVDTWLIEPLDDFYSRGALINITEYVDTDSIEIERHKLYKTLNFEYEKSQSFLNVEYLSQNKGTREYGNTKETFSGYDGGEFSVKVPFEDLLSVNLSGTTCVGYSLTPAPDYKSYIPKPTLLYMESSQSTSFKFKKESTTVTITAYRPFVQEVTYNGFRYSLNFSAEQSILDNAVLNNSLYQTYYAGYISNLFNIKNRITRVKAYLPISVLTSLQLNDRLIIRDKRYIINEISSDITSGEVSLSLIHDFREIANLSFSPILTSGGGTIDIPINIPNLVADAFVSSPTLGVTASPDTFTSDGYSTITYPVNPNLTSNILLENGDFLISETAENVITEQSSTSTIQIDIDYTYINGSTSTTTLNFTQL